MAAPMKAQGALILVEAIEADGEWVLCEGVNVFLGDMPVMVYENGALGVMRDGVFCQVRIDIRAMEVTHGA